MNHKAVCRTAPATLCLLIIAGPMQEKTGGGISSRSTILGPRQDKASVAGTRLIVGLS